MTKLLFLKYWHIFATPITLNTKGSVPPLPGNRNCLCFKTILQPNLCFTGCCDSGLLWLWVVVTMCYERLLRLLSYEYLPTMSLFQEAIMTNLLFSPSASLNLPIFLPTPPFGKTLPLNYKILVFLTSSADLLNPAFRKRQPICTDKRLALVNLAMMICVRGLSPLIVRICITRKVSR